MTHESFSKATGESKSHHKGHGRYLLMLTAALLGGTIMLLWGWNTIAEGLFGAPRAQFVHALAFEAAVFGLMLPYVLAGRMKQAL